MRIWDRVGGADVGKVVWTPLVLCLLALGANVAEAQDREVVQVPGMLEGMPFSSAVRVGDMLYLSGQIGVLPGTMRLPEGGVAEETRQTMENIGRVLEYAGSSFDLIVKCTVFLVDMADYGAMNEVYIAYFEGAPPARSTIAGSGLALGARVEIECIALVER